MGSLAEHARRHKNTLRPARHGADDCVSLPFPLTPAEHVQHVCGLHLRSCLAAPVHHGRTGNVRRCPRLPNVIAVCMDHSDQTAFSAGRLNEGFGAAVRPAHPQLQPAISIRPANAAERGVLADGFPAIVPVSITSGQRLHSRFDDPCAKAATHADAVRSSPHPRHGRIG